MEILQYLNTAALFVVALLNLYVVRMIHVNASDIRKIEVSTNSMKDALVESTDKAARAEGHEAGRMEELSRVKKP